MTDCLRPILNFNGTLLLSTQCLFHFNGFFVSTTEFDIPIDEGKTLLSAPSESIELPTNS